MLKKIFFFYLLVIHTYSSLWAQLDASNHKKYWYYRHRLKSDFLVIGEVANTCESKPSGYNPSGYSIPAHQTFVADKLRIHWADGTTDLGFYIGVLATEYLLLKKANHPTDSTLKELYYAMKAFERLDTRSAAVWPPHQKKCLYNGYFVRDDVDSSIFSKNKNFDKYKHQGKYLYDSDASQNLNLPPKEIKTVTADQIHNMYVGLALVQHCLDSTTHYKNYYFLPKAIQIAHNIVSYLDQQNICWFVKDEFKNPTRYLQDFRLKQGGNLWNTSHAAAFLTHKKHKEYLKSISPISRFMNKIVFDAACFAYYYNIPHTLDFNIPDFTIAHMAAGIAVGHTLRGGHTEAFLKKAARDGHGFYYLLHQYLYNKKDKQDPWHWADTLNKAPCYGTLYRPVDAKINPDSSIYNGAPSWRAVNKWITPSKNQGDPSSIGIFHGLDYMIMYNLYLLYYDHVPHLVGNLPSQAPIYNEKILTTFINNCIKNIPPSNIASQANTDESTLNLISHPLLSNYINDRNGEGIFENYNPASKKALKIIQNKKWQVSSIVLADTIGLNLTPFPMYFHSNGTLFMDSTETVRKSSYKISLERREDGIIRPFKTINTKDYESYRYEILYHDENDLILAYHYILPPDMLKEGNPANKSIKLELRLKLSGEE